MFKKRFKELKDDISVVLGMLESSRKNTEEDISDLRKSLISLCTATDEFLEGYKRDRKEFQGVIKRFNDLTKLHDEALLAVIKYLGVKIEDEYIDDPSYTKEEVPKIKVKKCVKTRKKRKR